MKSFSSSSFASDNAVALDLAAEAVRDNPHALFTDFQWFLLQGRDTVFFTAFSKTRFDARMLQDAGYRLEKLKAIVQFLWSGHVESIALFAR